jgi:hypothetical protein
MSEKEHEQNVFIKRSDRLEICSDNWKLVGSSTLGKTEHGLRFWSSILVFPFVDVTT